MCRDDCQISPGADFAHVHCGSVAVSCWGVNSVRRTKCGEDACRGLLVAGRMERLVWSRVGMGTVVGRSW